MIPNPNPICSFQHQFRSIICHQPCQHNLFPILLTAISIPDLFYVIAQHKNPHQEPNAGNCAEVAGQMRRQKCYKLNFTMNIRQWLSADADDSLFLLVVFQLLVP